MIVRNFICVTLMTIYQQAIAAYVADVSKFVIN